MTQHIRMVPCTWSEIAGEECGGEIYLDRDTKLPMCKVHSEEMFRLRYR